MIGSELKAPPPAPDIRDKDIFPLRYKAQCDAYMAWLSKMPNELNELSAAIIRSDESK